MPGSQFLLLSAKRCCSSPRYFAIYTHPTDSFTTIDPQRAIGYLQIDCACARFHVSDKCKPNYGSCINGRRSVPIELLDVAGLVPGAHEGKGLGNKFLDDLRHADALIHVVDVSGTTDAEGKVTRGYDPSVDIVWLRSEIVQWVLGNLMVKYVCPSLRLIERFLISLIADQALPPCQQWSQDCRPDSW